MYNTIYYIYGCALEACTYTNTSYECMVWPPVYTPYIRDKIVKECTKNYSGSFVPLPSIYKVLTEQKFQYLFSSLPKLLSHFAIYIFLCVTFKSCNFIYNDINISMLIGADAYWCIVQDTVI